MASNQGPTGENRRKPHRKPGWRAVFLAELEKWGVVDHAIHTAGVAPSTAYEARQRDPKFAAAWDEAEGRIVATMEVVARQRALVGVRVPVIFQGKVVDTIQEVDSGLLKWLLVKKKPEVYGDKLTVTGDKGGPIKIDVTSYSTEQLQEVRNLLGGSAGALANGRNGTREEEPA
jgi:hypothetical protein